MTAHEIVNKLNSLNLFEKLKLIRDTPELTLQHDNGWFWLELNGESLEDDDGNGPEDFGEMFCSSSDMDILLSMAGL